MSQLQLKGKVLHMAGPWGPAVPAAGAQVKIFDVDAPGNPTDEIWSGTTGADGVFQGTSAEWRDRKTISIWVPTPTFLNPAAGYFRQQEFLDPLDVLMLQARISQQTPQGFRETTVPFVFAGDNVMSPPLVANWGPPQTTVAKVNDAECRTPEDLFGKVKAAVDARTSPISIQMFGANALTLQSQLDKPVDELRNWVTARYNLPPALIAAERTASLLLLLGLMLVYLAVRDSVVMTTLFICVTYAVNNGYQVTDARSGSTAAGETVFSIKLERKTDATTYAIGRFINI